MYILADIEWVELTNKQKSLTQLSALRVDEHWDGNELFTSLCRPRSKHFCHWSHIAYTGADSDAFRNSPAAAEVLHTFNLWLQPDDIVLWWGDQPQKVFMDMMTQIAHLSPPKAMYHLNPYFKAYVKDGMPTKGSPYQLAEARNIPVFSPAHDSRNDVLMLQRLLQSVALDPTCFRKPLPVASSFLTTARNCTAPFHYVPDTNIIHHPPCSALQPDDVVHGHFTLQNAFRKHAVPCMTCCIEKWADFVYNRNQSIIERSGCSYFYIKSESVFHRATCRKLYYTEETLFGIQTYRACIMTGRTPCPICAPQPDERSAIVYVSSHQNYADAAPVPSSKQKVKKDTSLIAHVSDGILMTSQNSLTASEKQSVRRHQQASRERKSLDLSGMNAQEKSDALALSSSAYAFWAAEGYSTFHTRSCPKLNGLHHLQGFARHIEALHAGYQPCKVCRPTAKSDIIASIPIDNRVRTGESLDQIMAHCRHLGFQCEYHEPDLTIQTAAGKWIMNVVKRPIFMEHQHTEGSIKGPSAKHWQPRMFLSLEDAVRYIAQHDKELGKS